MMLFAVTREAERRCTLSECSPDCALQLSAFFLFESQLNFTGKEKGLNAAREYVVLPLNARGVGSRCFSLACPLYHRRSRAVLATHGRLAFERSRAERHHRHEVLLQRPVCASPDGSGSHCMCSAFAQVFNPSWIVASVGTAQKKGLLVRTQNCSATVGTCVACSGAGAKASVLTFAELINSDGSEYIRYGAA
jgi:hypothetical protein